MPENAVQSFLKPFKNVPVEARTLLVDPTRSTETTLYGKTQQREKSTKQLIALLLCLVIQFGFAAEIGWGVGLEVGTVPVFVPEGTKVRVRLEQELSSATADQGQPVQLSVLENVMVNEQVGIPAGTSVHGKVLLAQPKRRMGRTGRLDFSVDEIALANGHRIPVRYFVNKKEGGSHAVSTGIITAGVAVLFWPAAPFVLLRHGKDYTCHQGMIFEVFTDVAYPPDAVKKEPTSKPVPAVGDDSTTSK